MLCLKDLGLFRVFLAAEGNAVAGLRALARGILREQNHEALLLLESSGVHTTFNLLMFDPETTLEDLDDSVEFLEAQPACHASGSFPSRVGALSFRGGDRSARGGLPGRDQRPQCA